MALKTCEITCKGHTPTSGTEFNDKEGRVKKQFTVEVKSKTP